MKEIICPICGKNDIPDFHSQDVVCPCCGSDLSVYRLLEQAATPPPSKDKNSRKHYGMFPMSLAIILLAFSAVFFAHRSYTTTEKLASIQHENSLLKDTNNELQASLSEKGATPAVSVSETGFIYTVRNGDSFWSISKKLYGTGSRYKEIAETNNLDINAVLRIGDELIVK